MLGWAETNSLEDLIHQKPQKYQESPQSWEKTFLTVNRQTNVLSPLRLQIWTFTDSTLFGWYLTPVDPVTFLHQLVPLTIVILFFSWTLVSCSRSLSFSSTIPFPVFDGLDVWLLERQSWVAYIFVTRQRHTNVSRGESDDGEAVKSVCGSLFIGLWWRWYIRATLWRTVIIAANVKRLAVDSPKLSTCIFSKSFYLREHFQNHPGALSIPQPYDRHFFTLFVAQNFSRSLLHCVKR